MLTESAVLYGHLIMIYYDLLCSQCVVNVVLVTDRPSALALVPRDLLPQSGLAMQNTTRLPDWIAAEATETTFGKLALCILMLSCLCLVFFKS